MKTALRAALAVLLAATAAAAAPAADQAMQLCATNPAYSPSVMRSVVDAQLQKDHDPALDTAPPDQIAAQAVAQGVEECAAELRGHASLRQTLAALPDTDRAVGWDAYNTACSDHVAKADCITAEIGAMHALRHMAATDTPPGAHALVEDCQLVLRGTPALADWRQCVDRGLALHAAPARARACRLLLAWHSTASGAEAGTRVAACLAGT